MVLRVVAIAVLAGLAVACAPTAQIVCPRLVDYPAAVQREAAAALETAPPVLVRLVEDYGRLRAEVRALCP